MNTTNQQEQNCFGRAMFVLALLTALACPARAQRVTEATAREVAQGWVATITRVRGGWVAGMDAQVREVRPLKQGQDLVGYYCGIEPAGYVVVSPYEGLAPVKAYSTSGRLDADSAQGMAGMIKLRLHRQVKALEDRVGVLDQASPAHVKAQLKRDFSGHWQTLRKSASARIAGPEMAPPTSGAYLGGRVLLSTAWEQNEPYNSQCPSGSDCAHTAVGCVPLAAAQIMRYWGWPSWGRTSPYNDEVYAWSQMPDKVSTNSDPAAIDAVARLCRHAGMASGADYGCNNTTGYVWYPGIDSMDDAFDEQFRYSVGGHSVSPNYYEMKGELLVNQPMLYAISTSWTGGHAFVVDGWMEFTDPDTRWLHVNYGWGMGNNLAWVNADEDMPEADGVWPDLKLVDVLPEDALHSVVAGDYSQGDWPAYRYVNVDAVGTSANFAPGQTLQFLPTAKLTGTATDGNAVTIRGAAGNSTRLLSQGDRSKGIVIYDGTIRLANGGGLSLVPVLPPRYVRVVAFGSTMVSLDWEHPYGRATHSIIERRMQPDDTWVTIASVSANRTGYADTNVPSSYTNFYRLRSVAGGRLSAASQEIEAKVEAKVEAKYPPF